MGRGSAAEVLARQWKGGFIFTSRHDSVGECHARGVFGLPQHKADLVLAIEPAATALFLFDHPYVLPAAATNPALLLSFVGLGLLLLFLLLAIPLSKFRTGQWMVAVLLTVYFALAGSVLALDLLYS